MATVESPAIIEEAIAINAPIADVFAALTEPEQLTQWWGSGETYRVAKMEADVRPGGKWITTGKGKTGDPFSVSGVYTVVEPPHLVEFTWQHDWNPGEARQDTVVRYELSEAAGVTTVRVTHSGFTSQEDRDDHAQGWPVVLAWLRGHFAK